MSVYTNKGVAMLYKGVQLLCENVQHCYVRKASPFEPPVGIRCRLSSDGAHLTLNIRWGSFQGSQGFSINILYIPPPRSSFTLHSPYSLSPPAASRTQLWSSQCSHASDAPDGPVHTPAKDIGSISPQPQPEPSPNPSPKTPPFPAALPPNTKPIHNDSGTLHRFPAIKRCSK